MSRYVKAFEAKNRNKYKNNKLMFFHIDDGKSLKKNKTGVDNVNGDFNNIIFTIKGTKLYVPVVT